MWYVPSVTSTSANATMMKLPEVAKEEMSHPIIHHFKKANTIQPCTSKFGQFHHELSSKHILQHIFPKMNCLYTYLKIKTKQSSITANASIHVIRTGCYQHQRKRNHDEITSSCQTRNVKPHNPSFQKTKHHSSMHIKILSIPSWIIVQTYFATYLPEDELLIYSFEKQNQAKQHHSKCINTCDTYKLLPAPAQTQPWWNYQ